MLLDGYALFLPHGAAGLVECIRERVFAWTIAVDAFSLKFYLIYAEVSASHKGASGLTLDSLLN